MSESAQVHMEVAGPVARLVIENGRLNTLTSDLLDDLRDAVAQVVEDPEVRVVVLAGAGTGFSAGAHLASVNSVWQTPSKAELSTLRRQGQIVEMLRGPQVVTLAAIDGPCAGAGLSLALACDIRVATTRTKMRVAFASAGLSGDLGVSWTLPRLVGESRARDLFLRDPKFDAAQALAWGIVSEVVDSAALAGRIDQLATQVAALSPAAVAGIKMNLSEALDAELGDHLSREGARHLEAAASAAGWATRLLDHQTR